MINPQAYRAIKPMFTRNPWRIFVDDVVQIVRGPEEGVRGRVLAVIKDNRQPAVIVEGVNLRKKKIYTGVAEDDYFVVTMEAPVAYNNVQVVDPNNNNPVSTIFRYLPDGTRVRIGLGENASKQVIPIPQRKEDTSKLGLCGNKDTPREEVLRTTYDPRAPFPWKAPLRRPSGLPMPAEQDVSRAPEGPPKSGVWAVPAWFGMPRSMQPSRRDARAATAGARPFSTGLWHER